MHRANTVRKKRNRLQSNILRAGHEMQARYGNRAHMSKYIIIQCLGEYCLEKKVQNLQGKYFFKSWARHVER